ncbi:MAG TPA: metallophosphoesterase [Thermodesulfovibrionia bacterium]|nr:metallophosphoesterase [Thermodesulfovibrionia bacterium]
MEPKKILFISDVHLGAGRFSDKSKEKEKYQYDWDRLSEKETKNFEEFLKYLIAEYLKQNVEVVLLGDIFDNWVFPHDLVPPTMEELLTTKKNENVVKELKLLSEKVPVFYIPGNHDMHATNDLIKKHFPMIKYCPEQYVNYRLIAEHGHRYAMFNAPARFSDNYLGLPLGYFISRIEASRKAMTNKDDRTYQTYIDDFIEVSGKLTLPQCVLEAVIEEADLDEEIEFKVKRENGQEQSIALRDVKEMYKDIYNDWPTGIISRHRAVFAELDMLGPIADTLCKNGVNKVCILGHSHKCEIDKDAWFVKDRVYANAGYWCGSQCTLVEVEKKEEKYDVCIKKWEGQELKVNSKIYSI